MSYFYTYPGCTPSIDYVFSQKREMLVRMIEFDEEWSSPWIAAHPRPASSDTDIHDERVNEGGHLAAGRRGQ